jgi:hypothetical protein
MIVRVDRHIDTGNGEEPVVVEYEYERAEPDVNVMSPSVFVYSVVAVGKGSYGKEIINTLPESLVDELAEEILGTHAEEAYDGH